MSKQLSNACLVVIDALEFVDRLIAPSMRSSKFGCDSLRMIGIEPRDLPPRPLRTKDWDPPARDRHALRCVGLVGPITSVGGIIQDCKRKVVRGSGRPGGYGETRCCRSLSNPIGYHSCF